MAEVATQSEVDTGTDHARIVTPKTLTGRLSSFVRNASETVRGFVEIATQTEANSNTDDTHALTPKKLYNRTATESRRGVAEVATQSEVDTGTDHTRIVTPKSLKNRLASFVRNATETVKGFLEIATQSEVNAGTDHARAVTPKTLWGLLTAKFARIDIRPTFSQGINTGGNPIVLQWLRLQYVDHIWYDDTNNTWHAVADASEGAIGNANFKMSGIQLSSGSKVTGVSDSITSSSSTIFASSKAAKTAYDRGTYSIKHSQYARGLKPTTRTMSPRPR